MPYIASHQDQTFRIDTGEENQQRTVTIDGQTYTIDWRHIAPLAPDTKGQAGGGLFSLIVGGKSYEILAKRVIKPDEGDIQTYEIHLAGQRFEIQVEDEREKALAGAAQASHDSGEAKVRAPMPGLVVGVPFTAGAAVTRGQTVIVLEAMKMENDLGSPLTGTIKEVKVSKGQTVNQGDILVVIAGD